MTYNISVSMESVCLDKSLSVKLPHEFLQSDKPEYGSPITTAIGVICTMVNLIVPQSGG